MPEQIKVLLLHKINQVLIKVLFYPLKVTFFTLHRMTLQKIKSIEFSQELNIILSRCMKMGQKFLMIMTFKTTESCFANN